MKGARYIASPVIFLFAVITADAAFKAPTFAGKAARDSLRPGLLGSYKILSILKTVLLKKATEGERLFPRLH